jgi:metal-responsive CopG/Arc/MetJ family transcriptional regulator
MGLQNDKQFQMRVSEDFLRTIDDWRRHQPELPSRAEAIRQLIHTGLAARPILLDIQKMLVGLRPVGGASELDEHIEAIHKALNPK